MNPAKTARAIYKYLPWMASFLAAMVYFFTMAPSFLHTDSGELAAVQYNAGIAHPTGYPLFSLLGWLFTRIPITHEPILQLNFLCLIYTAASAYFVAKAISELFARFRPKGSEELPDTWVLGNFFAVLIGTLVLAFSKTWWAQSTSVEVYSLHQLLLGIVFHRMVLAWFAPANQAKPWIWLAFFTGLAFTNHMTTILLIPALIWIFLAKFGLREIPWKRLGIMTAVFFGVIVVVYSYLPLRASAGAFPNWGNPSSWDTFWHHVSGTQFRVWMFEGKKVAAQNFTEFFMGKPQTGMPGLFKEFMWVPLLFSAFGVYYLWTIQRKWAIAMLLTIIAGIAYTINYSIKDLDTYYVVVYLMLAVFAGAGIRWVWVRLNQSSALKWGITALALAGIGLEIGVNFGKNDESENYLYHDYATYALGNLPKDAVLISHQWDFLISPAWYLQVAQDFRKDVSIVEYEMFRARHWYAPQMAKQYPELAVNLNPELDIFAKEVAKFDLGKPHDVRVLSGNFDAIWRKFFAMSNTKPVYIAPEMVYQTMARDGLQVPQGYSLVPELYFFRILPQIQSSQYRPMAFQDDPIRYPDQTNYYTETIRQQIAILASDRALYELAFGHPENAKQWKAKALKAKPDVNLPPQLNGI